MGGPLFSVLEAVDDQRGDPLVAHLGEATSVRLQVREEDATVDDDLSPWWKRSKSGRMPSSNRCVSDGTSDTSGRDEIRGRRCRTRTGNASFDARVAISYGGCLRLRSSQTIGYQPDVCLH